MNKSLKDKLFFEFSAQEILNILEALSVYKNLILAEKYRPYIDKQVHNIMNMLQVQGIDLFVKDDLPQLQIGKEVVIDIDLNQSNEINGILLGVSDIENLFKVAIIKDNKFEIIDVPINAIKVISHEH